MDPALDQRYVRAAWALAGLVITAFVVFVVLSFVGAIVVGVFLYYATRPVYRWLDDRLPFPDVSATLTLLVVGLPLLAVLAYAAFVGVQQLDRFLQTANLEQLRASLRPYVDVASATNPRAVLDVIRSHVGLVRGLTASVFLWLFRVFVVVTVAFYLLRDDHKIAAWFRRSVGDRWGAVEFAERVDDDLTTIYTGNLVTIGVSGLIAILVYYGLDAVAPAGTGVAFPLLLGLLTGVGTLVPAVGMKLVYWPYAAYLAWQAYVAGGGYWFPLVFFLVTLVVVDALPDIFVRSYVSSGSINMGLMLHTYVLGAAAFGWYGVFLAPIILVLFLHFARDVFPALVSRGASG